MSSFSNSINNTVPFLNVKGTSSGVVTVTPQAAAGTYNFNLPIDAGTAGYLMSSAGGGASPMTWTPYAMGTFTPVLQFGGSSTGITYNVQEGEYTQIGNVVFFNLDIDLTNKGSATGVATITGFPVNNNGLEDNYSIASTRDISFDAGYFSAYFSSAGLGGTNTFGLNQYGGIIGYTQLMDTNFANNSQIKTNGFYIVG